MYATYQIGLNKYEHILTSNFKYATISYIKQILKICIITWMKEVAGIPVISWITLLLH